MKYSDVNPPLQCIMYDNFCYQRNIQTQKSSDDSKRAKVGGYHYDYNPPYSPMKIKGVLWHDTASGETKLSRYVQPNDKNSNKDDLLNILGKNTGNNDWNRYSIPKGMNAFIGKDAKGNVTSVQTMPWNFIPLGNAAGVPFACNLGWIQFEICDDGYKESKYLADCYIEACELTAYLCKKFGLNPQGQVDGITDPDIDPAFGGKGPGEDDTARWDNSYVKEYETWPKQAYGIKRTLPVITCHKESGDNLAGSGHNDVYGWFSTFSLPQNMDRVRSDVTSLLNGNQISIMVKGKTSNSTGQYSPDDTTTDTDYSENTLNNNEVWNGINPGFLNQNYTIIVNEAESQYDGPKSIYRSPFSCPNILTKGFGKYKDSENWHNGEDHIVIIQSEENWKLYSVGSGEVIDIGNQLSNNGYYITIKMPEYNHQITYSHLKELPLLKIGDVVNSGDFIGIAGNTGNSIRRHLHIELRDLGTNILYVPSYYIDFGDFKNGEDL